MPQAAAAPPIRPRQMLSTMAGSRGTRRRVQAPVARMTGGWGRPTSSLTRSGGRRGVAGAQVALDAGGVAVEAVEQLQLLACALRGLVRRLGEALGQGGGDVVDARLLALAHHLLGDADPLVQHALRLVE